MRYILVGFEISGFIWFAVDIISNWRYTYIQGESNFFPPLGIRLFTISATKALFLRINICTISILWGKSKLQIRFCSLSFLRLICLKNYNHTFLSEYWFSGVADMVDDGPEGVRKPLWSFSFVTSTRKILIRNMRFRTREMQTGIVTNIWWRGSIQHLRQGENLLNFLLIKG